MTQIPLPPSLAGVTPEQMQAMISFFFQHQPGAHIPSSATTVAPEQPSTSNADRAGVDADMDVTADGYVNVGAIDSNAPSAESLPPANTTPPRPKAAVPVPSTPRVRGNASNSFAVPDTAASTPSSKMAQLTLEGRMLPSTPTPNAKRRAGGVSSSTRKGPLPTGHDPLLIFEDAPVADNGDGHVRGNVGGDEPDTVQDGDDSDPYEGFPEIVTKESAERALALHRDTPAAVTKSTSARRKRNEPTTARWMNTRRTRTSSESSPPPVQSSPKKKARVASPSVSPVPTRTYKTPLTTKGGIASPFESPDQTDESDVKALERILRSMRRGEKIPAVEDLLKEVRVSAFLDTEAACSDEEDEEDGDGNLKDFVVNDDVVEYDEDAPVLPDEEDTRPRRLFKRGGHGDRAPVSDKSAKTDDFSDIEIVPTLDKGKGRAPPPPPSPPPVPVAGPSGAHAPATRAAEDADVSVPDGHSTAVTNTAWQTAKIPLADAISGLHPGSTAVDSSAPVCPPLVITPGSPVHSWTPFACDTLARMGYSENTFNVPGDCALILSDYKDEGWGTPSVDIVAAAETHVHVGNLLRGMQFRRHGPYINESQVDPEELEAVDVSPPSGTTRYKIVIKETRAPAVSITPCIVRYWRLDNPTAGPHPVYYICVTPFEGCFDRAVALECMKFGQRELYCIAFNNAIRMSTLPSFDRPSGGPTSGKVKPSSSIRRGKNAAQPPRCGSNFELSTNDSMTILDARSVPLPRDMSTWHTSLPVYEGVPPKDAVALVAHTTNMWVGTRSSPPSYNVQYNLVYIILLGSLPAGFV